MRRLAACALVVLAWSLLASSCTSGEVRLHRGALGPATYRVTLAVSGAAGLRAETVTAQLSVAQTPSAARLRLRVGDSSPIEATLERKPDGQFALTTIEGVSPRSAGEADLASIVGQLDPPLPADAVRLRDTWSSTRTLRTSTLRARLTSRLALTGYRRISGRDAVLLEGTIRGTLRTTSLHGTVRGRTSVVWAVEDGNLVSSSTRLTWSIPQLGDVVVATDVTPG